MAALDFPTSPTNGQKYPASPVVGVPTYTWDGEKWTTVAGSIGGGGDGGGASVLVSDTPPVGAPDKSLWWESDKGQLYIRFNDGSTTQWVTASSYPDSYPNAPVYNGLQTNGSMEVSQENGSSTVALSSAASYKYIVDGWAAGFISAGATFVAQQVSAGANTLPVVGGGRVYFSNYLQLNASVAMPAPAAGDYANIQSRIEGYRVARLGWGTNAATSITIGFWVLAPISGLLGVSVHNGAFDRSYVTNVTATAGTWEYKTVMIPGDTAGTWLINNGIGLVLNFCFASGTTFRTSTPDAWTAGNFVATAAQGNFFSPSGSVYITGVTILPGTQAPTAAQSPFIMRPYDEELTLCKRYYQQIINPDATLVLYGYNVGTATPNLTVPLSVEMRAVPTLSLAGGAWVSVNLSGFTFSGMGTKMFSFSSTVVATGPFSISNTNAGAGIIINARL